MGCYDPVLSCIESRVTMEDNAFLLAPFTKEEFFIAIKQMHLDKSPHYNKFGL